MYLPDKFALRDDADLLDAIERWNFGLLVSTADNQVHTSSLPFSVNRKKRVLEAHMARANPQWETLENSSDVLVSFQGPHSYISPGLYVTPNLVPTWNYLTIEVRGRVKLVNDPADALGQMKTLVSEHEQHRESPWSMDAVDPSMLQTMLRQIVCFELTLDEISGKAKMSQNRPQKDRESVIRSLSVSRLEQERDVAGLMRRHNPE